MSSIRLTDAEIRAAGWAALIEKLGPSGALRFAMQTERGYGDYADLRHKVLGALTVEELMARMKGRKRAGSGRLRGKTSRRRRKR